MSILKRISTVLLIALVSFSPSLSSASSLILTTEAHQGRTDAYGGHRDNKNKSGLGSYHYHCGGNPPHLHTNGACPYSGNSSSNVQKSTTTTKSQTAAPSVPANVSLVFDSGYYAENNSDLKQAYGTDYTSLLNHFLTSGMKEGRIASATFNVQVYKDNNSDLMEIYGDDLPSYYNHYMNNGYSENRIAK